MEQREVPVDKVLSGYQRVVQETIEKNVMLEAALSQAYEIIDELNDKIDLLEKDNK